MIEKINQSDTRGNIPKDRKNQISKVVKSLQEESESTKPQQTFRFTKEQTNWITYLLDKYGDDFQVNNSNSLIFLQSASKFQRARSRKVSIRIVHFFTGNGKGQKKCLARNAKTNPSESDEICQYTRAFCILC